MRFPFGREEGGALRRRPPVGRGEGGRRREKMKQSKTPVSPGRTRSFASSARLPAPRSIGCRPCVLCGERLAPDEGPFERLRRGGGKETESTDGEPRIRPFVPRAVPSSPGPALPGSCVRSRRGGDRGVRYSRKSLARSSGVPEDLYKEKDHCRELSALTNATGSNGLSS